MMGTVRERLWKFPIFLNVSLNHGRLIEHPVRVHDELAVLQAVEIQGDPKEVG